MKKFLAFSAAVAIVASLQANTIDWSLPTLLESGNGDTVNWNIDKIVFVPTASPTSYDSTSGVITGTPASGSSDAFDQDDDYVAATWTDNLTGSVEYYMAYQGGDGVLYAIANPEGGGAYTVTANSAGDPLIPGSKSGNALLAQDESVTSVSTVAQVVPEPATAVLALAGIAMLIRRRKA